MQLPARVARWRLTRLERSRISGSAIAPSHGALHASRPVKIAAGVKVGPYEVIEQVGRGGMATVFKAYQPALERHVAIKVLPEFLAEEPGFKERFHREAVAVARFQHPNILTVYDHGEQDGVAYIVNEYIEGGTLQQRT